MPPQVLRRLATGSSSTSTRSLKIGPEELAWKYYVPPFLTFLFTDADFVAMPYEPEPEEDEDEFAPAEDPGYDVLGYQTSRDGAIANLEAYGYTLDFFARVCEGFYDELEAGARESVRSDMEFSDLAEPEIERYIDQFLPDRPRSPRSDLDEFVLLLRQQMKTGQGERSLWGRFEDLQSMLMNRHREFTPATLRLAQLFEEDLYFDYGDVVSLMYVRLLLEAAEIRRSRGNEGEVTPRSQRETVIDSTPRASGHGRRSRRPCYAARLA